MATLLHGDCLEVMKTLPDKSIDCVICDLPYGQLSAKPLDIPNTENKHRKACPATERVGCPWDVKINLGEFWEQVKRLVKDDHTPVLMFCNTRFGFELISSNPTWFRYDLVWNKQRGVSFLLANKQPMKSHEMVYVFSKKAAYYKRIDEDSEGLGKRCSLSVFSLKKAASRVLKGSHPTEKPIELYTWLLERYCPAGGTVLDPTAGSFNAVKAAVSLGLKAVGIEKDDGFFKQAESTFGLTDTSGDSIRLID